MYKTMEPLFLLSRPLLSVVLGYGLSYADIFLVASSKGLQSTPLLNRSWSPLLPAPSTTVSTQRSKPSSPPYRRPPARTRQFHAGRLMNEHSLLGPYGPQSVHCGRREDEGAGEYLGDVAFEASRRTRTTNLITNAAQSRATQIGDPST
jgi:hypothetical protein